MITCFISCWETATIFNYDFVYFTCNIVITVWLLSFFFFFFLSLRNSSGRERGKKRIKSKKEGKIYEGKEEEGEKREEKRGRIINSMFSLKEILNKITNLKDYKSLMWKQNDFFYLYKKPVIKTTHYVIPYIWFSVCAPSCSTLCDPMDCSLTGSSLLFFQLRFQRIFQTPG